MLREGQPVRRDEAVGTGSARAMKRVPLAAAALGILSVPFAAACGGGPSEEYPDDGFQYRSVHHEVINPLNEDQYSTFEFRNRKDQARSEVNFHHLKSNPQKYERLVTSLMGENVTVLEMQQVNVPLGDIEFQHSEIKFLNTTTGQLDTLQINRVKPETSDAFPVTAYSMFIGKENPKHIGTLIFSDRRQKDGKRGEFFVALKEGTFGFEETSEVHANAYMKQANDILTGMRIDLNGFYGSRVDHAVWKVRDEDGMREMHGVLGGNSYMVRSKR